MGETITVTIPGTPDACVSPNSRVHWRVKAKHVQAYRETARLAALAVCNGHAPIRGAVTLHLEYGWEKGRKMVDWDNAVAISKCAIDGLVAAGIMADDRYVVGATVEQRRDPDKVGYLAITVKQAAPGVGTAAERGGS